MMSRGSLKRKGVVKTITNAMQWMNHSGCLVNLLITYGFYGVHAGSFAGRDVAEDNADDGADDETDDDAPQRNGSRQVDEVSSQTHTAVSQQDAQHAARDTYEDALNEEL